jgi:hypothetical protein
MVSWSIGTGAPYGSFQELPRETCPEDWRRVAAKEAESPVMMDPAGDI